MRAKCASCSSPRCRLARATDPIQILWINLVTDGIPALALAMEKPAPDVMTRRPRPPKELFFTRERGRRIIIHGLLIATVMIAGFAYAYAKEGAAYARAVVFYITVFAQLGFSFACRSQRFTLPDWHFHEPLPARGYCGFRGAATLAPLVAVHPRDFFRYHFALRLRLVADLRPGADSGIDH